MITTQPQGLFVAGAPLYEPLQRLWLDLRDTHRTHIALATAEDTIVRQEAMAALGERLSGSYTFHVFDMIDPPAESLPRFCRTLVDGGPFCVMVTGFHDLKLRDPDAYARALHFLNTHREDVRHSGVALVLWLTQSTLGDVLEDAADFADWHTVEVTFSLPQGQRAERTALGRLSLREAESLRHQACQLEKMLGRDGLSEAMRRDFEEQLDRAKRRLGRVPDPDRDVRQLLMDELGDHVLRGFAPKVGGQEIALPLREVFLPLQAVEGRPTLSEYAERDLERQAEFGRPEWEAEGQSELDWRRRRDELEKHRAHLRAHQSAQRYFDLERLLGEPRAVLLGDPGSGKTTVTRYVAWALAAEDPTHVGQKPMGRLPVLVRLATYGKALEVSRESGGDLPLLEYVERQLFDREDLGRYVVSRVESGECLVILDGLDEVSDPALRLEVVRRVQGLVAQQRKNHFLVTSRIVGYERSPLTQEFTHATLRELAPDDRERFVGLWYGAIRKRVKAQSLSEGEASLVKSLQNKPQVARLAANPLLLTIMVLMHFRGVKLPSHRVQVYEIATDTLIEHWTAQRRGTEGLTGLDALEIKRILAPVAHYILSSSVGGVIARRDLLPRFRAGIVEERGCSEADAEVIGDELLRLLGEESGLFLERGLGSDGEPVYGFLHQTFGEYLAALHLAELFFRGELELGDYLHRSAWHEPLLLLAGHLSVVSRVHVDRLIEGILGANSLYEEVLKRDLLMAMDCLVDDVQVKPGLRDRVLEGTVGLLDSEYSELCVEAQKRLEALKETRHRDRAVELLVDRVDSMSWSWDLSLVSLLISLGEKTKSRSLLEDHEDSVNRSILLLQGWPDEEINIADSIEMEFLFSGPEIEDCVLDFSFEWQGLGFLSRRVPQKRLIEWLKKAAQAVAKSDKEQELTWMAALVENQPEKFFRIQNSRDLPPMFRAWAAAKLLYTGHHEHAMSVLHELSERGSILATSILAEENVTLSPSIHAQLLESAWLESNHWAGLQLWHCGEITLAGPVLLQNPSDFGISLANALAEDYRSLAFLVAAWTALSDHQYRLHACDFLIDHGWVDQGIKLLIWLAYDSLDLQAIERLMLLGETERVLPLLIYQKDSFEPDRQFQAFSALALLGPLARCTLPTPLDIKLNWLEERRVFSQDIEISLKEEALSFIRGFNYPTEEAWLLSQVACIQIDPTREGSQSVDALSQRSTPDWIQMVLIQSSLEFGQMNITQHLWQNLIDKCTQTSPRVQKALLKLAGNYPGLPGASHVAMELSTSPLKVVKLKSLDALGKMREQRALLRLASEMGHTDSSFRHTAINAITSLRLQSSIL